MSTVTETSVELFDPKEAAIIPHDQGGDLFAVIARAAADPAVDVQKLERLLALRDRELARVAENEFNAAMKQCQAEIPAITKNAANSHTNSRYATLEAVNDRVVPAYTRNGFSLSFGTADSQIDGCIRLTCHVSHVGGHSRDYQADLPLDGAGSQGKANKTGVQAFGSTVSYGRRYLTCLIFNLTISNEDHDGRPMGQAPDADPGAPKVLPRAERKANQPDDVTRAVASAHSLWASEKAGEDKGWPAFFAWAEKVTGVPGLTTRSNWTVELAKRCEEACK